MANLADMPVASTTSRSASRGRRAASGQAASTVTENTAGENQDLMPSTPPATTGTETTTAASAPSAPRPLFVLAAKNPKRGKIAPVHFEYYYNPSTEEGSHRQITTLEDAYDRGVRGKDVSWDMDRLHILVGDDAKGYMELESDDDKRAFLEKLLDAKLAAKPGIGTKDKMLPYVLKQAGLWVEPAKPEAAAAPEATQTEQVQEPETQSA